MFKKMFYCDRAGCTNSTPGLSIFNETGQDIFSYDDESWLGVQISKEKHFDFCSWECLSLFVGEKIKEVRGGK
ncbi:MAG: hypothetical protein WC364_14850 [Eubacteriales bacterium]|jgi:hypothetical protein